MQSHVLKTAIGTKALQLTSCLLLLSIAVNLNAQGQNTRNDLTQLAVGKQQTAPQQSSVKNKEQKSKELLETPIGFPNLKTATMGGMQIWTDQLYFRGFRIQQNAITSHYRLLDKDNYRLANGNFAHCKKELAKIKTEQKLEPFKGKAVILLHGFGRSRLTMVQILEYLKTETDYHVYSFGYASTRGSIDDHALGLQNVLANLEDKDEIYFVCHSLGNLVVRRLVKNLTDEKTGKFADQRLKRMVMLGPPNQGAKLAKKFESNLVKGIVGSTVQDLSTNWDEFSKKLATPPFEFGIVAGNVSLNLNPLTKGETDMIVAVDEAKLVGARDFRVIKASHGYLLHSKTVREFIKTFLENGYFESEKKRQPIEKLRSANSSVKNEDQR